MNDYEGLTLDRSADIIQGYLGNIEDELCRIRSIAQSDDDDEDTDDSEDNEKLIDSYVRDKKNMNNLLLDVREAINICLRELYPHMDENEYTRKAIREADRALCLIATRIAVIKSRR